MSSLLVGLIKRPSEIRQCLLICHHLDFLCFRLLILSKPKAVNHGILLIMNDSSIFFLALRSVFRLLYTKLMYMCAHFDAYTCLFTFVVKYYSYKLCIFRGCMYLNHTIFKDSHVKSCESMQRSVPMRMSIAKH